MIRPATDALTEDFGRTAFVVVALAFSMLAPGVILFAASSVDRLVHRWFALYRPIVYLGTSGGEADARDLANDIENWEGVSRTTVRSPKEAYRQTVERLGEDEVTDAGVQPGMFPYSVVVEPEGAAPEPALASRIEALKTRETVRSVDVPSSRVLRFLASVDTIRAFGWIFLVLLGAFGVFVTGNYLKELRCRARREFGLLERFGLPSRRLRRATLIRGAVLGTWAGLVATGILLVIALYWRTMDAQLFGGSGAASPRSCLVVAAPLVVGPLAGLLAGLWRMRPSGDECSDGNSQLESILDYD